MIGAVQWEIMDFSVQPMDSANVGNVSAKNFSKETPVAVLHKMLRNKLIFINQLAESYMQ